METILIILIACGFVVWFFTKPVRTIPTGRDNIVKLDDENWVIDGNLISLEEDTTILKFRQKMEDNNHYRNFEIQKLSRDRERLFNEWVKTKQAIRKYPDLKNCITVEKLETVTEKYDKYLFMCKKLNETLTVLNKEEFLIKEENPKHCADFSNRMWVPRQLNCYKIHCEKTAKYLRGDMGKLVAKEFKDKWY